MFGGHIEKEKDNFLQKTRQERENRQKVRVQSVAAVKIQVSLLSLKLASNCKFR